MATAATAAPLPMPSRPSWMHALLQDLSPTPGRLNGTLRIVLSSVIALILLEVLQMPFIAVGMYFIFLIGRDSPAISLRSSVFSFAVVVLAIVIELSVVILTDNDPIARILSVAAVTFIGGLFVVTTNTPALGSSFGLIFCTVISLWELHAPADRLVKTSLYLVGTFVISLGSAVAVEYVFGVRDPAAALQEQRRIRYAALETLFRLSADNAPPEKRFEAGTAVSRLAVAGQSGMISLYNTIVERNLSTGSLPIAIRPRITMLAQLMDVAAAFGLQNPPEVDPTTQARCRRIADECKRLAPGIPQIPSAGSLELREEGTTLLDHVESDLHAILTMPLDINATANKELATLPSHKVPFFIPGALKQQENIAFGLKISLCATFCYILYHALDWNGISTCVTTVMVTGLSSSGAIKQKFAFRLLGAILGGLLLGIGATVYLFPHMDSITSLIALEAFIAFISAWVAAGPKFNYIGLQIAFSFYSVAYEGFSAPTELAPARDRLMGILIALAIMWLVFDQLWPVRTIVVMRRGFASVLRLAADLLTCTDTIQDPEELRRHTDILRDQVGKTVAGIRTIKSAIPYDLGSYREQHIATGEAILRATLTSAALFWNQLAMLHTTTETEFRTNPKLRDLRDELAAGCLAMADAVLLKPTPHPGSFAHVVDPDYSTLRLEHIEYGRNAIARYRELEDSVRKLPTTD